MCLTDSMNARPIHGWVHSLVETITPSRSLSTNGRCYPWIAVAVFDKMRCQNEKSNFMARLKFTSPKKFPGIGIDFSSVTVEFL